MRNISDIIAGDLCSLNNGSACQEIKANDAFIFFGKQEINYDKEVVNIFKSLHGIKHRNIIKSDYCLYVMHKGQVKFVECFIRDLEKIS